MPIKDITVETQPSPGRKKTKKPQKSSVELNGMFKKMYEYRRAIQELADPFEEFYQYEGERNYCGDIEQRKEKICTIASDIRNYLENTDQGYFKEISCGCESLQWNKLTGKPDFRFFMRVLNTIINSIDGRLAYQQRVGQGEEQETR